jgi:hypothetical protein
MWTNPPEQEDDERLCPRCGTPFAPGQDYCLECGLRLGAGGGLVARLSRVWTDRLAWYPGDWVWPVLLAFVIAALGAVAAVIVSSASGKGGGGTLVATHAGHPREPVTPPATATVALPTVPKGTPTNGYTVVVESVPTRAGRNFAVSRARAASQAGLPQVGVIDSGEYSSLHPGYYVVFSGIYATKSQADGAAQTAAGKGFGSAYSRQIIR